MPRPRKRRMVRGRYNEYYFKPKGVRLSSLEQIDLTFDEIEALKYVDLEELNMDEAAKKLKVSKPTVCRIVNGARKKMADAVINGKAINIAKYYLTHVTMPNQDGTGPNGEGPKTGRGMGNCKGANSQNDDRPRRGQGRGMGRGRGRK